MLNIHTYEGKTREQALEKCLNELNTIEENLIINEEEKEGSLFKSKKVILNVINKSDIIDYIGEYIKQLSYFMDLEITYEVLENDNIYNVQLISNNNSILIGKDGRTINAIQLLIRQSLNNTIGKSIKVNVDVSNYKNQKMKRLEREIKNIAKDVLRSKVDVSLDPMNSYERRIVHSIISEIDGLETESVDEGLNRHVIIKYIEK